MDKSELLKLLNAIFIDVLETPVLVLRDGTTANEVAEWDSLRHMQLVVAIEKQFRVRFTSTEIQQWKNVGDRSNNI